MSLATPGKIRELQKKLYVKAKQEPDYRFYVLYDKIQREEILWHAYQRVKANGGGPGRIPFVSGIAWTVALHTGVDGQSFWGIEQGVGLGEWLTGIRKELREKTYQPAPVRRKMIRKIGGGERPLGIPTIRDRVVQAAAKLVLEPIFEADLEPCAYGYRPKRSALDAVKKVHEVLIDGNTDVG
jgi:RNA-directed DNA polymerase